MRRFLFYLKFFLKGGYCNDWQKLKWAKTSWIGKSVTIFFEKPSSGDQSIELGEGVRIGHFSDLTVGSNHRLRIKDYTTINTHCKIIGDVTIERYCLLSSNILISSGAHYATRYPHMLIRRQDEKVLSDEVGRREHSKPVHIEEDVWIGVGVYIKQGITIGRGSVIGANSVVLKDIPPYEIHGGNPARKLKDRLDFRPKNHLRADSEEDRPYFYRGFDHYYTGNTKELGLPSYGQSSIAIPFFSNETIILKGIRTSDKPILLKVSVDNFPAGEHSISENMFELKVQITAAQFLKRKADNYSFLNFEAPNSAGSVFSIISVDIINSL